MTPTPTSAHSAIKPWLFLDVDGVLIPGGRVWPTPTVDANPDQHPDAHIRIDVVHSHMGPVTAFIPDAIVDRLRRLAGVYDIVWLTTWAELALDLEPLLGIRSAGCLKARQRGFSDSTPRKGEALAEWLSGEYGLGDEQHNDPDYELVSRVRPFAWVDDDLHKFVHETEQGYYKANPEWIGVCTEEKVGLTESQTRALLAFAQPA